MENVTNILRLNAIEFSPGTSCMVPANSFHYFHASPGTSAPNYACIYYTSMDNIM